MEVLVEVEQDVVEVEPVPVEVEPDRVVDNQVLILVLRIASNMRASSRSPSPPGSVSVHVLHEPFKFRI